jgi:hypothetical protein
MAGIMIRAPYAQAEVMHNHVERDRQQVEGGSNNIWHALHIDQLRAGRTIGVSRIASYAALRIDAERTLVMRGDHAYVHTTAAALGASASVLGNVLIARGRVPTADVSASGEVLFNDNRCELRFTGRAVAVLIDTPAAVINGNRVRGGLSSSISVANVNALVAAIGNITTNGIQGPLKPEIALLNLLG